MRGFREIVVVSGKGGTGKTSVCAAFAAIARKAVLCDLDVDVPDLHIVLSPRPRETHDFMGGNKAVIDLEQSKKFAEDCERSMQEAADAHHGSGEAEYDPATGKIPGCKHECKTCSRIHCQYRNTNY